MSPLRLYRDRYGLDSTVKNALQHITIKPADISVNDLIHNALHRTTNVLGCSITYGAEGVSLGKFLGPLDEIDNLLVLRDSHETPIAGLSHSVLTGSNGDEIMINLIQATRETEKEKIDEMKTQLGGVHPFEFLMAHFLERISPVLNDKPGTNVRMDNKIPRLKTGRVWLQEKLETEQEHHMQESLKLSLYQTNAELAVYCSIRDRFFDKDGNLNPNRIRVRQILGENNNWMKQRK